MSYIDEYSTVRATWDVVLSHLVQDAKNPTPDKVIASFMHYRDCYVFVQGIAAADGVNFGETVSRSPLSYLTRGGHMKYTVKIRDVYIGKGHP